MSTPKIIKSMNYLDDDLITDSNKRGGKRNMFGKIIAAAAAVAVIITGGVFARNNIVSNSLVATVAFDVNPSIEFSINKKDKVVDVEAKNDDARTILGDMDLENVDVDVAVNAIIGSMLQEGYLSNDQNSILISVDSNDSNTASSIEDRLTNMVSNILSSNNIAEASILSQEYDKSTSADGISAAKNTLINKILDAGLTDAKGTPYTYKTLSELNINDLKAILESKDISLDGVKSKGNASTTAYISRDEAFNIALSNAGIDKSEIIKSDIELDYDHGTMIYEIELETNSAEFDYDINAITGEIIKSEIDRENNNHNNSNQDNQNSTHYYDDDYYDDLEDRYDDYWDDLEDRYDDYWDDLEDHDDHDHDDD